MFVGAFSFFSHWLLYVPRNPFFVSLLPLLSLCERVCLGFLLSGPSLICTTPLTLGVLGMKQRQKEEEDTK